jgi:formylglycine-generating enzyme required for sulfatase activity
MVRIPAGAFLMGRPLSLFQPDSDLSPQTRVTLTDRFWIGKFEVTRSQYEAVVGSDPSAFKSNTNLPVQSVSWVDATNFCAKLTKQERRKGRLPIDYEYRLPTEAEWEYACLAGSTNEINPLTAATNSITALFGGQVPSGFQVYIWDTTGKTFNVATFGPQGLQAVGRGAVANGVDSDDMPHSVGTREANTWGLHDMHGNMWEWCRDAFGDYPGGSVTNPVGASSDTFFVIRGGSIHGFEEDCQCDARSSKLPSTRDDHIGFRVVLAHRR